MPYIYTGQFFFQKFGKQFFWVNGKKTHKKSGAKKKNWCKIRGNLYNLFFNKFSKKPPVNDFGHNGIET